MSGRAVEPSPTVIEKTATRHRLYFLDWARVFAFSLLIVYHTGLIYVAWPWHIKSEVRSDLLEHILNFVTQWRIPLLFFVSGAGTALAYKGDYFSFLKSRTERILIPLAASILLVLPWQFLLERYWQGVPFSELIKNPVAFFIGLHPQGNFTTYHLWYLRDLWRILAITVPILFLLNNQFTLLLKSSLIQAAVIFFSILALAVIKALPQFDYLGFALVFTLGFITFKNPKIFNFKHFAPSAFLALSSYILLFVIYWRDGYSSLPLIAQQSVTAKWAFRLLIELNVLASIYALIAFFKRYLNRKNRLVEKLNMVILPVYIFHQVLIMGFGIMCIKLGIPPIASFFLIQMLFWPTILVFTKNVVVHFRPLRSLFGVRV